jgi:hypothetical protein
MRDEGGVLVGSIQQAGVVRYDAYSVHVYSFCAFEFTHTLCQHLYQRVVHS